MPTWLAVLIGSLALIGPALVYGGIYMGRTSAKQLELCKQVSLIWKKMDERDETIHDRVGDLEEKVVEHLIEAGHLHVDCPLAKQRQQEMGA